MGKGVSYLNKRPLPGVICTSAWLGVDPFFRCCANRTKIFLFWRGMFCLCGCWRKGPPPTRLPHPATGARLANPTAPPRRVPNIVHISNYMGQEKKQSLSLSYRVGI
jgi:hypothetical protein